MQKDIVYTGYTFDPQTGFTGTGATNKYITEQSGYYRVMYLQVTQYGSADYLNEDETYKYYRQYSTVIAECRGGYEWTSYSKGSTFYGKIEVDDNVLPEQGTLLSGSIEGNHCVIKVNNNTYYYEKVV